MDPLLKSMSEQGPVEDDLTKPPPVMEFLLEAPPKVPESCPKGKSLWLFAQRLDDVCVEVFASACMRGDYAHLEYLNMGRNRIGARGMHALAGALREGKLPKLLALSLETNKIDDEGLIALAGALKGCPDLQSLELHKNGFGDPGFVALCNAGATKQALMGIRTIFIGNNGIADEGVSALCAALRAGGMPVLDDMHLDFCKVTGEGALMFSEAIEEGLLDFFKHLHLTQCPVGQDGMDVIEDTCKECEKKVHCHY